MDVGELLTRGSIWLALMGYALGAGMMLQSEGCAPWRKRARWAWTAGCVFFVAHVICAFAFYHGWSHAAAVEETARQTAAMTGVRSGGGLWLNYAFAVAWLADVLWWWIAPRSFARRPTRISVAWHCFFFFMVFNGAVVFADGPVRWLGILICGGLAALWWRKRKRRIVARTSKA